MFSCSLSFNVHKCTCLYPCLLVASSLKKISRKSYNYSGRCYMNFLGNITLLEVCTNSPNVPTLFSYSKLVKLLSWMLMPPQRCTREGLLQLMTPSSLFGFRFGHTCSFSTLLLIQICCHVCTPCKIAMIAIIWRSSQKCTSL